MSPNHDARGRAIDMLLLHYTGMESAAAALGRLCDSAAKVSAHYLIDEDGTVTPLVPEDRRAWHAGVASWQGAADINARSIGIELVNPGHAHGYRAFPEPQLLALERLAAGILARHAILPQRVLGHSDVAPRRKEDPGELFPWPRFAALGIGVWPTAAAEGDPAELPALLARIGYEIDDLPATLRAFQRHWRPARIDGLADAECAGLALALLQA